MPLWAGHGNGEDVAMPDSRTRLGWFLTAHPSEVIEAYAEDGSLHESICVELTRLRAALQTAEQARDEYRNALSNHLCEHDMADWVACSGHHDKTCDVCEERGPHHHELDVYAKRAETAESATAALLAARDRLGAQMGGEARV